MDGVLAFDQNRCLDINVRSKQDMHLSARVSVSVVSVYYCFKLASQWHWA